MVRNTPINTCLAPVKIDNVVHGEMFVSCGHCPSCESKLRAHWASRLKDAVSAAGVDNSVFFTLTYNNDNLPLAYFTEDGIPVDIRRGNGESLYYRPLSSFALKAKLREYLTLHPLHAKVTKTSLIPEAMASTGCKRHSKAVKAYILKRYAEIENAGNPSKADQYASAKEYINKTFGSLTFPDELIKHYFSVIENAFQATTTRFSRIPFFGMKPFVKKVYKKHVTYDEYNDCPFESDSYLYKCSRRYAVSYKEDIQLFLKYLRFDIEQHFPYASYLSTGSSPFTYFIVSEYGPTTLRPHYHGILIFHASELAKYYANARLLDIWGRCDVSSIAHEDLPSIVRDNAAGYVSKYVCRKTSLPSLLRFKPFAPFHVQSNSIGCTEIDANDVIGLVENAQYKKDVVRRSSDGAFVTEKTPYRTSSWLRFFPKFVNERDLDENSLRFAIKAMLRCTDEAEFPNLTKEFKRLYCDYRFRLYPTTEPRITHYLAFDYGRYEKNPDLTGFVLGSKYSTQEFLNEYDLMNNDIYFFGIPENRCAIMKIYRFCRSQNISADRYIQLRRTFISRRASLALMDDYQKTSYYSLPDFFRFRFLELFSKLPNDIEMLNFALVNGSRVAQQLFDLGDTFDLDISDFYDDITGKLKPFDNFSDGYFVSYYEDIKRSENKFQKKRKNKSMYNLQN